MQNIASRIFFVWFCGSGSALGFENVFDFFNRQRLDIFTTVVWVRF